jgi:ParB family transcriptional regulator, chromosome partitioning protein
LKEERSKSNPNLKHQLTLLEAQLSQSREDLHAARKAADDRESELAATRQQHATDHARLTTDIAAARRENSQLALKIDEASVLAVSRVGTDHPELLDQLTASRREAARLALELDELKAAAGVRGDTARLAADVAALRRENSQLALELEEAKALASGRVRAASQLSDTLAEVQELSAQLAEARQQARDHQRVVGELAEAQRTGHGAEDGGAGAEELRDARQQVRQLTAALAEAQFEAGGFQHAADTALEQVQGIDAQMREMQAALERALDRACTAERAAKEVGELRAELAQRGAEEAALHAEVAALQRALQRADEQVQRLEERAAQLSQQAQAAAADKPAGGGARTAKRMQDLLYSREKELRRTQERVHQLQGQISSVSARSSTPRAVSPGRSMSLCALRSSSFGAGDGEGRGLARSASLASPTTPEVRGGPGFQPSSPARAPPQRTLSEASGRPRSSPARGGKPQVTFPREEDTPDDAAAVSAREGGCAGSKDGGKASRMADPAKRICCYDTSASDFYSDSD